MVNTTLEKKNALHEAKNGRFLLAELKDKHRRKKEGKTSYNLGKKFECKIDPNLFEGEWLNHRPTTYRQKNILNIFLEAKAKGRLHSFTCMTISPSVQDGKLIYQKGLPIITGFSQNQWLKMLREYDPTRNSREITRTEYVCKRLFLIPRLLKVGYTIDEAWKAVCDDSRKLGHYCNSNNFQLREIQNKEKNLYNVHYEPKDVSEPTGSREICGFSDMANNSKLIMEDPWYNASYFLIAGGHYSSASYIHPLLHFRRDYGKDWCENSSVGEIVLD